MSLTDRIKYAEMKARHAKDLRPWYKKWWGALILAISALILIVLVASAFYVYNKVQEINSQAAQNYLNEQKQAYLNAIAGGGTTYSLGSGNPQITIVEFSDFACPYCAESAVAVRKVAAAYQNQVKIIFRDYPLHDNSIDLALAARCAGEQGKFWEFHDYIFANQNNLSDTGDALKTKLLAGAQSLKLNTDKFSTCLTDKTYLSQISTDFQDGETLQVQGTPTWFVNNYRLTGSLSEQKLQELIAGLLK